MSINDVDLNKLRVFAAIVAHGGVSGAARHLALTRSALSQSLSGLESTLGLRLFDRVGKRMLLTREGRLLHDHFGEHQEALRRTLLELTEVDGEPTGPIRVGLFLGSPRVQLADLLAAFGAAHPRTSVRVVYAPQADLDRRLLQNRLDFVLSFQSREDVSSRIASTSLFEQELVLAGSRSFLSDGFEPERLGEVPVVDYYRSDCLIRRWLEHHFPGRTVEPDVRVWAATTDLVLELLLRRAGVGVLPRPLAEPWQRRRRIVLLETARPALTDFIWLNEIRDAHRPPALQAFRKALLDTFAEPASRAKRGAQRGDSRA